MSNSDAMHALSTSLQYPTPSLPPTHHQYYQPPDYDHDSDLPSSASKGTIGRAHRASERLARREAFALERRSRMRYGGGNGRVVGVVAWGG